MRPAMSLAISTSKPSTSSLVGFFSPNSGWSNLVPTMILPVVLDAGHRGARRELGAGLGAAVVSSLASASASSSSSPHAAATSASTASDHREQPTSRRFLSSMPPSCLLSGRGSWTGSRGPARSRARRRTARGARSSTIAALVHEDDPVGGRPGEAHLVADDDHRRALGGQLEHDVEDLLDHLGVERGRGLVEQHDLGLHGQRPGDGGPLLLSAGQLGRVAGRPCRRCRPARAAPCACSRGLAPSSSLRTLIGPEGDVLEHGLVGEQVERLEDHADVGPQPGERLALLGERRAVERGCGPLSMGSSRLMLRHSVDLPEPDGPITTTTSPAVDGRGRRP